MTLTINQLDSAYQNGLKLSEQLASNDNCCLIHNQSAQQIFNAAKDDPTRTITIRKRWIGQFNKRFRALKGDINRFILHGQRDVVNQTFDFKSDVSSILEFLAWLQTRIDARIFDNIIDPNAIWQNVHITQAYERGTRVAVSQLRKQGIKIPAAIAGVAPAVLIGTATVALGAGSFVASQPIHLDAIQLLYTRDFAALKGITQAMSAQISRVLVDGIEQGLSARQIAANITNRVDKIGLTRAKLLARTETVRAYNMSVINQGIVTANEFDLQIEYLWKTAGDELVRSTHTVRNGIIYTAERAAALVGEPNCRCSLIEFVVELDTPEDRRQRTIQREKGIAIAS